MTEPIIRRYRKKLTWRGYIVIEEECRTGWYCNGFEMDPYTYWVRIW